MKDFRVREAFLLVREGRAAEYVICDPRLNENFLVAARQLGVEGSEATINSELINLRKANLLKDYPATRRKKSDPQRHRYINAVLNAVRLVERQFNKNVDEIICDPQMRVQFDAMIQFLSPGTSSFEAQYAALSLRKSNRLRPEPVGQVIRAVASNILNLSDLESQLEDVPEGPGIYIFWDDEITLYAGKAERLRNRIQNHISTWSYRDLINQINKKERSQVFVVYHALPVTISAKELAAYEIEIIRSRNPEYNRAGKLTNETNS